MASAKSMALKTKEKRSRIHPQKFALWVACASMIMFFAAFTSGYIVRRSAGNWLEFVMPNLFFYNRTKVNILKLLLSNNCFPLISY